MNIKINCIKNIIWEKNNLNILLIKSDLNLALNQILIETKANIKINKIIQNSPFKGKYGEILTIIGGKYPILLVGIGLSLKNDFRSENLGGKIYSTIALQEYKGVNLIGDNVLSSKNQTDILSKLTIGIILKSYKFNKYKDKKLENFKIKLNTINIISEKSDKLNERISKDIAFVSGIFKARDLISEPANVLNPSNFVSRIKELSKLGIKVEILEKEKMKELGMNALLGVAKGSRQNSYVAIMKWEGGKVREKPLAFVGKGVCFDSGGLSLKSPKGMEDMKWDMGGAAIVTGAMETIALQKIKRNVVGVIGLVENMPDGNAQRPGDIVKSMSGKTIEVLNTDAEGRLVLADALFYTNKFFKPSAIVDLATLTGAIIVALGNQRAGLFSNNQALADHIINSGNNTGELVWQMPLDKDYSSLMNSSIADLKNIGSPAGSSIQAACFLEHFVGNTPWAHLDVAGMVWSNKSKDTIPSGGTGWGVKLLVDISKRIKT